MTALVSFPLAKLLNSMGFDKYCSSGYTETGDKYLHQSGQEPVRNGQSYYEGKSYIGGEFYYPAPTIAEVCMWLYEKHGILIAVNRVVIGSDEWDYGYIISYLPKEYEFEKRRSKHLVEIQSFKEGVGSYHGAWYTPTEAYEAAIKYTLNNLI